RACREPSRSLSGGRLRHDPRAVTWIRGAGVAGLRPHIPCLFGRLRIGGRGGGAGDHGEPPLGVNFNSTSETAWAMRSCWFPPTQPIHQRAMSFVIAPRTRRTLMRSFSSSGETRRYDGMIPVTPTGV